MRFSPTRLSAIIILFSGTSHAIADLETARATIVTILDGEDPTCIAEFNKFCKKYDDLVLHFFDKKNNDPLKMHIAQMETELQVLKNVCDDPRYQSINPILHTYHTRITELVILLKQYVGSHDTLSLAFKVREFKTILPLTVKQRGELSLFWSLYHRLRC